MSYSDFSTIEHVLKAYPLQVQYTRFLPDAQQPLPEWLLDNLDFALRRQAALESEAFFSESFIYPLLQYAWKQHAARLKLWSHQDLNVDATLRGAPDYFVSYWPEGVMDRLIYTPLLIVIEAKRDDFSQGWAQCLAAMIACQKLNEDASLSVYGIVSNGVIWQFGRLIHHLFWRDVRTCSVADDPERVAGLLQYLFAECERQMAGVGSGASS